MKAERPLVLAGFATIAAIVGQSALAHHSDSLYFVDDRAADGGAIRIEGTISRVRWINPHSEFFVDVPNPKGGEPIVWAIETDSVNQLRGLGWDEHTLEVGDKGININVVKSGLVDTDSTRKLPFADRMFEGRKEKAMMGERMLSVEDVADAVLFLASPLSDLVQGEVLTVDGGAAIHV